MQVLEMQHIVKSFDGVPVLQDISLRVDQGQVLAIIGPSGSGKSTLLRCATTLESVDSGHIQYHDDVLVSTDAQGTARYVHKSQLPKIRKHFGLVFQNFNLFPHMTVMKNIITAPMLAGATREEAVTRAEKLLYKMGLADKADAYPCQLSGGQQQRVSIARALVLEPDLLFFDEPTSALDPELTGEILKVIRDLAQEHMTMVIVTHEMSFARDVADTVIFMDHGVIVEEGDPDQVINHPQNERTRAFLQRFSQE